MWSEQIAKYNRPLAIEPELGKRAVFGAGSCSGMVSERLSGVERMVRSLEAMEFACPLCGENAFRLITPTGTMLFETVASYGQSKTNSN